MMTKTLLLILALLPAVVSAQQIVKDENDLRRRMMVERLERNAGYEVGGQRVFASLGEKARTTFTMAEGEAIRGGVYTHSHPGGNGFSRDDMKIARRFALREMRAITARGTFVLGPPLTGWESVDAAEFERVVEEAFEESVGNLDRVVKALVLRFGLSHRFEKR